MHHHGVEMPREIKRELLDRGIELRRRLLETVEGFELSAAGSAPGEYEALSSGYRQLAVQTSGLPESGLATHMAEALQIASQLCRWVAGVLETSSEAPKFLASAQLRAVALGQRFQSGLSNLTVRRLSDWTSAVVSTSDPKSVPDLLRSLSLVPLPVFYFEVRDPNQSIREELGVLEAPTPSRLNSLPTEVPIVKMLFFLDRQPWLSPQAIKSGVQYDFGVQIALACWPRADWRLEVDCVSIADPRTYHVTAFEVSAEAAPGEMRPHGHLIFYNPQSLLSEPSVLKVRARFVSTDGEEAVVPTIIGHTELHVRALSPESYPVLTRYPMVDIQIPKIIEQVKSSLPELRPSDLDDFVRVLVYLSRYAAMVAQTAVFKGKSIDEKREFQQHLLQSLRMTELGAEIREAETVGGGILDLRYRNVVIELKVEYRIKDRKKLKEKYTIQPCQYTISSIPLSITCILDMTEKEDVPPNVANDLSLESPPVHGYAPEPPPYPSRVVVVIIEGNLRSPSSYS
jgi:hypothetical protein